MLRYLIVGLFCLSLASCLNPPDYSEIPVISFDSMSTSYVVVGEDSVTFFINFTDGDGDLGSDEIPNLFFLDNRTGYVDSNKIPNITPEGNVKAISGIISFTRSSFTCTPPDSRQFDTVSYTVYVEDRAGNRSNDALMPQVTLQCQ